MSNGSTYQIDADEVLKLTNQGLQIILDYYPDAQQCLDKKKTHFKKRTNEKTASTTLRQVESNGIWIVTDFGDDQKSKNAIMVVQEEEGLNFYEALKFIVNKYNLAIEGAPDSDLFKPKFSMRPATKDERESQVDFEIRRQGLMNDGDVEFTEYELKEVLGAHVTAEVCDELNFYPLKSYTRIKNRKAMTWESTEKYPIFMIDEGVGFQKFYQPLSADKKFRFSYGGTRPKTYIFGLDFVQKCYEAGKEDWDPEKGTTAKNTS